MRWIRSRLACGSQNFPIANFPVYVEDKDIDRVRKDKETELKKKEIDLKVKEKAEKEQVDKNVEIIKKQKEYNDSQLESDHIIIIDEIVKIHKNTK